MALIKISESEDWIVDYDRERGMYRVSYFENNHFVDECWFDCYEEKELASKNITNFTFVNSEYGDWQALYINGKLATEGHTIRARDILDCIADIFPNKAVSFEIPQDIAEMGMPMCLDDFNT